MKKYSDLEYLKLPKWKRLIYTIMCVICGIPAGIVGFFKNIFGAVAKGLERLQPSAMMPSLDVVVLKVLHSSQVLPIPH